MKAGLSGLKKKKKSVYYKNLEFLEVYMFNLISLRKICCI